MNQEDERTYLALLWHQHQPVYKDPLHSTQRGSYRHPWVRLHAIRDYYSMAALAAEHEKLHLTINLTPALLWQIEDYAGGGATDRALELTLKRAEDLSTGEKETVLATFFDADWHHQIYPHPRYRELLERRKDGRSFSAQDVRDLQMWFNLGWFGKEFREGEVCLATGEMASVRSFVEQGSGFSPQEIETMIAEELKIMRAVIPIHRMLQDRGRIEVATSPFYHPILPLLIDSDHATIDRPGGSLPRRFAYPQDADAQVRRAVEYYELSFGRPPYGMWPAEGAVSEEAVPVFARNGVRWIATDRGVLARSGRWGYEADRARVLCRPYRAESVAGAVSMFFRDTVLSDAVGFHYNGYSESAAAARHFMQALRSHCAEGRGHVHAVILDGENAWGAYREDARPFLHALYGLLESDPDILTVTFREYIEGNPARGVPAHPLDQQEKIYALFTGSWIDEAGSEPGVDLGTWIGEAEENRAWDLLLDAREEVERAGATPESAPEAFEALYRAEGSDWFWWLGEDQDSGRDADFDELFRAHLQSVYRDLGRTVPRDQEQPTVPRLVRWTFTDSVPVIGRTDRLSIQTQCPGELTWQWDEAPGRTVPLDPAGGVMAGIGRYQTTLQVPLGAAGLRFTFKCTHRDCTEKDACCEKGEQLVQVL